jgi:hypothetical protein
VTGTKEAGAGLFRDGQEFIKLCVDPATTWTDSVPLTLGPNSFSYTQQDCATNGSNPTPVSVLFDNTPPTTPVVTDDGATTPSTTQLHATATSTDAETAIVDWCWTAGDENDPDPSDGYNNLTFFEPRCTTQGGTTSARTITLTAPMVHGLQYSLSAQALNAVAIPSALGSSDGITTNQVPRVQSVFPPAGSFYCGGDQVLMQTIATDPENDPLVYDFTVTYKPTGQQVFYQPVGPNNFAIWDTTGQLFGVYALDTTVTDRFAATTSYPTDYGVLWEIAVANCGPP